MSAIALGPTRWGLRRTEQGHRQYDLTWKVETTSVEDGPYIVLQAAGLPLIGSTWIYGNDNDPWAFCTPNWTIRKFPDDDEPGNFWLVETPFSTQATTRCQDQQISNPFAEPPRLSGSFVKYTRERAIDRHGKLIKSSSHELFRGADVEFDGNRPTVQVGLNLMTLPLGNITQMIDMLNDGPMWGLSARKVKLSNASWRRLLYGRCSYFYTVDYEFDIDFKTFDRELADAGTMVLLGWGATDPIDDRLPATADNIKDPRNFQVYKDAQGENTKILLDGSGRPLQDGQNPHKIKFEYYDQGNLFSLGVPFSL